jgi:hypothetical protein
VPKCGKVFNVIIFFSCLFIILSHNKLDRLNPGKIFRPCLNDGAPYPSGANFVLPTVETHNCKYQTRRDMFVQCRTLWLIKPTCNLNCKVSAFDDEDLRNIFWLAGGAKTKKNCKPYQDQKNASKR